ncbi:methyltransferase domain-containing protein [Streptoalloteichus tenebrarius]|nr:methyltransferase domain-containing protein [Streptoalloteichus tenebrarius]
MARMLETLDVRDEHRVLEIGTGTGYNAALLCHRLGDHAVASVDIDPDLVDTARDRLASLGYRPALVTGDGADGVAEHGPYDRIIATAAVPEIPTAWIKQLAPGGKILANVRGNLAGGTLCLLTKEDDDEVMGRFLPMGGHFMWLRSDVDNPHGPDEHPVEPVIDREGSRTTTRLDPVDLDDDGFRFLLQLALRRVRAIGRGRQPDPVDGGDREFVLLAGSDRSRAEVLIEPEPDGLRRVAQTGPRRLWDTVEATALLWHDLGRPTPDEFGLVANNDTQFVWLRHRDAWHRWPLPLV